MVPFALTVAIGIGWALFTLGNPYRKQREVEKKYRKGSGEGKYEGE